MNQGGEIAKQAANAHVRLNVFHTIVSILEGGSLPGGSNSANATAEKIIRLCNIEAQRQLRNYDRHLADLTAKEASE